MPFFGSDLEKQKDYDLAEASLMSKLEDGRIDVNLKLHVKNILAEVKKAKASPTSGLSTEQLIQILRVSENAMIIDQAMGMHGNLEEAISVHPCLNLTEKLKRINTAEGQKLRSLLYCLAGLLLILTSVALAVFTSGIAFPLSFAGISLGISIIVSGVLGVVGMSLGVKKVAESVDSIGRVNDPTLEIRSALELASIRRVAEIVKNEFNSGPVNDDGNHDLEWNYFTTIRKEEYFKDEEVLKRAQKGLIPVVNGIKRGDYARSLDAIQGSPATDEIAFQAIIRAAKEGRLEQHIHCFVKEMSSLFLDDGRKLKKEFKDIAQSIAPIGNEEALVIDALLVASFAVYSQMSCNAYDAHLKSNTSIDETNYYCHLFFNDFNAINKDIKFDKIFPSAEEDNETSDRKECQLR